MGNKKVNIIKNSSGFPFAKTFAAITHYFYGKSIFASIPLVIEIIS